MADHPTYSGLGLKHISLVAVLLCFLLQVTSGFSISQNKADFSEKDRFKREVPHSVHCKSSPRVPCGTDSSGRKRSGRFPDWTQEVQDELASIGYGDDILPSGLRRPQEKLSLLETMSRLKARMSNWRLQTSRLPGQELTKDLPTSSNAEELYGRFLPTTDFD